MGATCFNIYSINYFASLLLQTMPLAPPPPTLPPQSPPLHQSAPVGKAQDNKTVFFFNNLSIILTCTVILNVIYCISESVVTLD